MKIGILNGSDLTKPERGGGASGFISNILPQLPFKVIIFGIGYSNIKTWEEIPIYPNAKFISIANFTHIPQKIPKRLPTLLLYLYNRYRILNSGVDALYIHSPECALPFVLSKSKIPIVFHQHGSANPVIMSIYKWARNQLFTQIFNNIYKIIYKRADWIIAIDKLCLNQAVKNGVGQKVSLIMNAVDDSIFKPDENARKETRNKYGNLNYDFILLFVGRLEEVKNVDKIIDSFLYFPDKKNIKLYVAGDGTLRRNLERQVREKRLIDNVIFLGYISHNQLPSLYNMADVLVLPSSMEGTPMVVLEALSCGTPVIASSVGGIPDIVKNGVNGYLLEQVNPRAIAETIERMHIQRFDRLTVSRSVEHWSSKNIARELGEIFNKLIK